MPYAILNNIRMHFEVSGKGDAVLLINGLSAPAVSWAEPEVWSADRVARSGPFRSGASDARPRGAGQLELRRFAAGV